MEIGRMLLVDDHGLLTVGIAHVLRKYFSIQDTDICHTPEEALACTENQKYDLYILDLGFPSETAMNFSSINYLEQISKLHSNANIIVYTMREDFATVSILGELEYVKGIVLKTPEEQYLIEAVKSVINGDRYMCPRYRNIYQRCENYKKRLRKSRLANGLPTSKEIDIIKLIASGKKTSEIAEILGHTVSTIESYRKDLKVKYGVSNTSNLIILALSLNIITIEDIATSLI